MEEAEKKMNLKRVTKGNALKRKSEEKGREIDYLNKAIVIIELKKQKSD